MAGGGPTPRVDVQLLGIVQLRAFRRRWNRYVTAMISRGGRGGTRLGVGLLATILMATVALAGAGPANASGRPAQLVKASTGTVWLCRPGVKPDPCQVNQAATSVSSSGVSTAQPAPPTTSQAFDCFYVYGTVSGEKATNADLRVQKAETDVAVAQASRFSSVCRVWAPIYRQITVAGLKMLTTTYATAVSTATTSILSAFDDYLAHDNHGRPIIFIGHSQGASMVIRILQQKVDEVAAVRRRMVSALVIGGNVTVPDGGTVGSTFHHLPTCTTPTSTGCVIAYSSFSIPPPADSLFGIPGQGVSLLAGLTTTTGVHVACVNPGLIGSTGTVPITPYFPGATPATAAAPAGWVTYPGLYTATCTSSGNATWLQIDTTRVAGDPRPVVQPTLGPTWGLHIDDVNLPLGNLVADVAGEEAAWTAAHG
jgi:hypothetical protein